MNNEKIGTTLLFLRHIKEMNFYIMAVVILVFLASLGNAANNNDTLSTSISSITNIMPGVNSLAFNQQGILASARDDGKVTLWNATNGSIIKKLSVNYSTSVPYPEGALTGIVFSPDGNTLVTSSLDSVARIWNVSSGVIRSNFEGHEEGVLTTAISPDGKTVVTGGQDTKIMIWDVLSSRLKAVLEGHTNFVRSVVFGSNTLIASGSDDGTIKLWNITNNRQLLSIGGNDGGVNIVTFSPDKSTIASGTRYGVVKEWSVSTGQLIRTYMANGPSINTIAYSPKGNILVTADDNGNIRVWSRKTGSQIITLNTNTHIHALAYSLDSLSIASAGSNGIINLLNTTTWKYANLTDFNISINTTLIQPRHTPPNPPKKVNNNVIKNSISTASTYSQPFDQGPGGPILIITSTNSSNPFGIYYTEILRAEGFNAFQTADISTVTPTTLSNYDLVILSEMTLSPSQVTMISNWVNGGGRLIAMRPDSQLSGLLGITGPSGTINGSYMLINTSNVPGNGLVNQTIQFKGNADLYTMNGAVSIATLFSDANTSMNNPAVTRINVGNGQASSFSYDLAKSIIYMRQGNPAWVNQRRDSYTPLRSDELFYGAASFDPQPDWIDLNKASIPQADEQQRLFANIIIMMTKDVKPLPRFWYLPRGISNAVVMTGDDHANGGTPGRFDQYIAMSPVNCSVSNWGCIRGTSYIYPGDITFLNDSQALYYQNQGFEIGIHVQSNCADYTPDELDFYYYDQINTWKGNYPDLILPHTHRMHCIAWDGWTVQPSTEINHSIVFDTSYYYWPPGWVANRPGYFAGSSMPMRFSDLNGNLIDVYQAETQMTDESGQSYPFTSDSLLGNAIVNQYFGVFTVNAHTDVELSSVSDSVVRSALTRGIPIISSSQLLDWINGREKSTYSNISWNGTVLSFYVSQANNATGLQVMVPAISNNNIITSVIVNGNPTNYIIETIKGIKYAFIAANTGTFVVTYSQDFSSPMVTGNKPSSGSNGVKISTTVNSIFNKPMDDNTINTNTFQLFSNGVTTPASVIYNSSTFEATLQPSSLLKYSTNYTVILNGGIKDVTGNYLASNYTWSFTTASGPICPCSIWSSSIIPRMITVDDPNAVELGLKFHSDVNGYVTGIRFYKGPFNIGTHVGSLWDGSGSLLRRVNFSGEGASGWQQANFDTPVAVTAGQTYVVSYHTNVGYYSADNYYFISSGFDNPPLHALQNGADGGNGVYAYNSNPTFPTNPASYTNYWIDVVFTTGQTVTTVPVNLASKQGNFWVNYTWQAGSGGNIVDSYNVSLNGIWTNGSSNTYINKTVGPHNWSNIMVYAYNSSNKQLSDAPVTQNTLIANNIPVQDPIGPKNVSAGQILTINVHTIDADNDTITYGTNSNKGIINSTTGSYIWSTNNSDIGNYTWSFNSNDGYGGVASETIMVTVNNAISPNITFWSNNKTNDSNSTITINTGDIVNFNAIANQTITTWSWYKDGLNQINNYDNISTSWNTSGTKIVQVNATNSNGTSNTITWNIIVQSTPQVYMPSSPINITSITGNFWVNTTWRPGAGNITDSYNISVNGIWNNGTTNTSVNSSLNPHGWQNTTIYGFNMSGGGSLSTPVIENMQIPDNYPNQSYIGNNAVDEGQLLMFTVSATDVDNDTIIYSTNATKGTLNSTTGNYSWLTKYGDAGIYIWNFSSNDNYGGISSEMITVTVNNSNLSIISSSPLTDPTTIQGTGQSFNITLNRIANIIWYINGIQVQNSTGTSDNYTNSTSDIGNYNVTVVANDSYYSVKRTWNWTVALQPRYNVSGYVFDNSGSGLGGVLVNVNNSQNTTSSESGYYIIAGILNGTYNFSYSKTDFNTGYLFVPINGTDNNSANITIYDTTSPGSISNPSTTTGNFYINNSWINPTDTYFNHTWFRFSNGTEFKNVSKTDNNLNITWSPHYAQNLSTQTVDDYGNVNQTKIWFNVTIPDNPPIQTYIGNKAVDEGQWLNFTVHAIDADNDIITYGTNSTKGNFNTTTGNFSWLTTDADVGNYTWSFNSSDGFGEIANENVEVMVRNIPLNIISYSPATDPNTTYNSAQTFGITLNKTANVTWYMNGNNVQSNVSVTTADYTNSTANIGNWNVTVSATDGIDMVSKSWNWIINSGNYIPPRPINLQNNTGNFWVNYTWMPGIGNMTNSYNVSINGIWYNDTINSNPFKNITTVPHGWSNITVFAYNSSGTGSLSVENANQNTQVPDNAPIQLPIGNKSVDEGQLLTFVVSASDIDNDTIIYGTNATKGTLNSTTGNYSWLTKYGDAGIYVWAFNSSDSYGRFSKETITILVNSSPLSIISSAPLLDPITVYGTGQSFNITLNRTANIIWYINGTQAQNSNGIISDNYTNITSDIGTYLVTAIANDSYYSVERTWNWTVIPKPTYNVSGYVFDNYGSGLGNVLVQNESYDTMTTSSGHYLISGLNNGIYSFNYTRPGFNKGYLDVTINGTDNNSANITIYDTTPPYSIHNTSSLTGNFYINNTWNNPIDADFNYTWFRYSNGTNLQNVSSSINYVNISWSPHYIQNISAQTVDIYGNINQTKIWFNTTIANNPPVQATIGNKTVTAGNLLQFNVTSTDADSDPIIYGTNATGGSLNKTNGSYLWQTASNDVGIYTWYFNSSDNYGGVTSETITVNVTVAPSSKYQPPIPSITGTQGNFWINYTLQAGPGNLTDSYNVSINGNWTNGTKLLNYNNSVGPHGWGNITVWAYNNSDGGSQSSSFAYMNMQVANNIPVQTPIGNKSVNEGKWLNFTVFATDIDQDPIKYGTNATKGNLNSTTGNFSWLTTSSDTGNYTWYFNSSDNYGGVVSESITIMVNNTSPVFTSYSPLSDPTTLQGSSETFNVTMDRFVNITWYINGSVVQTNTSTISSNYTNSSAEPGNYNVSVIATDGLYISSKQWNWIVQPVYPPNIISWNNNKTNDNNLTLTVNTGQIINFNAAANQTVTTWNWNQNGISQNNNYDNFTTSWNTAGPNIITVNATNTNGTSNTITWNITVQSQQTNYIPPNSINLNNATGNFWVNYSWNSGLGNITDSYNVSTNGIWDNGTLNRFKNMTTVPHGWVNITVWAYNSSGTGTISTGSISQNVQLPNNPPIQAPIGNKTLIAGNLLNFTIVATDIDNDTITYGTNATKGILNASTGVYSWQTTTNDNGTYIWYFNSSDNYGGVAAEIVVINIGSTIIPKVILNTPASGSTGINISTMVTSTFNENMNSLTINTSTFELHMGNLTGNIVPANVSYNISTFVASLKPSIDLIKSTNYTVLIKGGANEPRVKDLTGNSLTTNFVWNFTTSNCPCSIWNATAKPGTITENDNSATELGVRFKSDINGSIKGIRFYKSPSNTGTHVGSLWTNTGTLLSRANFSGENASGWQQVNFTTPINITANTTYVASYHTNIGYYSDDTNYFANSGVDNPPLHALQDGVSGSNGVYIYNANPTFPNKAYLSSNYWVDVVFVAR